MHVHTCTGQNYSQVKFGKDLSVINSIKTRTCLELHSVLFAWRLDREMRR